MSIFEDRTFFRLYKKDSYLFAQFNLFICWIFEPSEKFRAENPYNRSHVNIVALCRTNVRHETTFFGPFKNKGKNHLQLGMSEVIFLQR